MCRNVIIVFTGKDFGAQFNGGYDHRQGGQLYKTSKGAERQLRPDLAKSQRTLTAGALHHSSR